MKPCLMLHADELVEQRLGDDSADVQFPRSLVAAVLEAYTSPGDRVLDPFAGFGTTLVVAERMGRTGVGVELLADRAELARRRLRDPAGVIYGDARRLSQLVAGPFDLCLTSPPYMTAHGHPQNPLTGYRTLDGDYRVYLTEIGAVAGQIASLLRPGGHLVLNAANIRSGATVTPLAWDIAGQVSQHLRLVQETILCWDRPRPDVTADYCLIYQRN